MRQLVGVERTRAISMAQQETVSLAQMLKVNIILYRKQNITNVIRNDVCLHVPDNTLL